MTVERIAQGILEVALEAAPWLALGLLAAGLVRALLPPGLTARLFGGRGSIAITRAAVIGAPLPLCSCGVLPVAVSLRRAGASRGVTASFLVSTPETGADSVAISYVFLGPFMTVARPVAALISAVATGLVVEAIGEGRKRSTLEEPFAGDQDPSCCDVPGACHGEADPGARRGTLGGRLVESVRYAFTDLLDDLALWLLIAVVIAGVLRGLVEPEALAAWGGGLPAMLAMLIVGIPLYICATASTPIAAGLLVAGLSPGATLVFLLAGPATNIGTLGVVRGEIGTRGMIAYLVSIAVVSVGLGLATDAIVAAWDVDIVAQAAEAAHIVPHWLAVASLALILTLSLRRIGAAILRRAARRSGADRP